MRRILSQPPPLPAGETPLGPMLGRAAHLGRERMDARLSRYDVTPAQTHTLLYLCGHGDSAPQRDVVGHLRVKPSTANGILERMEEKGLISRAADEKDQRQKRVVATEKGRRLRELVQAAFQDAEGAMIRGLSRREQQQLRQLLDRVIRNLEEDRVSW